MKSTLVAAVLSGLVWTGSVGAVPVMPEGQAGIARGVSIDRPPAPEALVLVGDDRYIYEGDDPYYLPLPNPAPRHRDPPVIRRIYPDYLPPKPLPQAIVAPYPDHGLTLPAQCQRDYFTQDTGWAGYLGARCLEENYRAAWDLPQYCALTIQTEGRWRDVYDEYCLRRAGYTVSGW